jgi:monoamine oxidase
VKVHSSAGAFESKTAIVTASLGVLQSGKIEFTPELTEKKARAIEELGMGPLIKVVVEFQRPFWEDTLGKVLGFQHGDSLLGSYSSHFWDRPGPSTLIMFLGADRAEEFKGDPGRIRSMMFSELGEMFPGVDLEEELVSLDIVDWAADPWALGGVSVGTVGRGGLRADLASPTPPLYWAGEATAEGRSAECVHGALETGRRAAIEVLHAVQPLYVDQPEATLDWRKYIPS